MWLKQENWQQKVKRRVGSRKVTWWWGRMAEQGRCGVEEERELRSTQCLCHRRLWWRVELCSWQTAFCLTLWVVRRLSVSETRGGNVNISKWGFHLCCSVRSAWIVCPHMLPGCVPHLKNRNRQFISCMLTGVAPIPETYNEGLNCYLKLNYLCFFHCHFKRFSAFNALNSVCAAWACYKYMFCWYFYCFLNVTMADD